MADNQGSARVTLREIDLSQVRDPEVLPQGVPAAVVGPAKRGPAFVPKTFANVQQFGDIFGSLSEISQDSNANRFGPLAINEWMRNAEAGAYVRVLGVGDGDGTLGSDNKTVGAGFVVGDSTTYSDTSLTHNAFANFEAAQEEAARAVARTHFLGCFMKDEAGGSFLQDAGIQTSQGASSIKITLDNDTHITAGSTLKIKYKRDATNPALEDTATFTFLDGESTNNDRNIKADGSNTAVLTDLMNAINGTTQEDTGSRAIKDSLTASLSGSTLTINSDHAALGAATNDIEVEFDMKSNGVITDINVGGKTASEENQTVRFGSSGNTAARFEVVMSDNPAPYAGNNDGQLVFNLVQNDDDATLTNQSVEYRFLSTLTDETPGNDVVADTYHINTEAITEIKIGATVTETLENFQAALARVATAGTTSRHQGLTTTSLDRTNNKLTIFQKNLGDAGNSNPANGSANITTLTATNTTITAASSLANARTSTTTTHTQAGFGNAFMFGGSDSTESKSLTLKLTGNAVVDDKLDIRVQKVDDVDGTRTLHMLFKTAANTGNGESGTPRHVKIGVDLQETLYNIRNAILDVANKHASARIDLDVDVVVSDANDSLTMTYKNNDARNNILSAVGNKQGGLRGDVTSTVEVGEYATFTNPSGFSLVGNHGPKKVNFTGGGGAAAPVIRGLLMTPQGVKATLDVTHGTYTGTDVGSFSEVADLRKEVTSSGGTIRSFGSTKASNFIGYELGKVDSENNFTVLLNGFNNMDQPAILTCSFNPDSVNYFAKVLNTDPEKIEECGHYLHAHWDISPAVASVSSVGQLNNSGASISGLESAAFCLPSKGNRNVAAANRPNFEGFETRFRTAKSPWIMSQKFGGQTKKLFRLYAQDDGAIANNRFRVLLSDLRLGKTASDWATFTLSLEAFDSDPVVGEVIASWKSLTLDPDSRNFIGRVLGNRRLSYSFKKDKLVEEGDFELRNKYVWVELTDEVMAGEVDLTTLPCGFSGLRTLNTVIDNLFDEAGTNGSGASRLLQTDSLDHLKVLPLPYVKTITRESGASQVASANLAWGVKFAKKQSAGLHKELGEIRINPSIRSWTKFLPDMGLNDNERFTIESTEDFSLENISWNGSDWATATYQRGGSALSGEQLLVLNDVASGSNVRYLKFRCIMQGGFDGLNIFNKEKAALSSIAAHREAQDETGDSSFTGPTVVSFQKAIDVLTDKSATEIQLLAIPGIREPLVTDYAITACESRFDAMLVMDVEETDSAKAVIVDSTKPHVGKTIENFEDRLLDTSFAAAYFPDVISRRSSNNTPIQVPPSVCMLGVMSQNDTLADPWFAPAGLTRGRLNASSAKVQMSRDLLNDLYDADINPIYVPAGRSNEVYAFGQKTLMQNQSALDRINVRRLLINIRRKVKAVANTLLFEPNRASTLERFSALVEPIMAEVQARQGVERYKVQIDTSTTTQNDVENNTIRGKVYLQPTKSVEFISLDFVVTNSID